MTRKIALVTGASSGIGYDLAILFAQGGFDLVLTARNRAALEELGKKCREEHGARVEIVTADLAEPATPQSIYDEIAAKSLSVEILVNNAGFGTHGPFAEEDLNSQLQMVQVNVTSLIHLTRLFLPEMLKRKSGKIMNVASVAGFVPGPYMSTYYASKAFVLSHSVALAEELRDSGVTLTVLCPGPTTTEFQKRAGISLTAKFSAHVMSSRSVARAGYRGLMQGKTIVVPGAGNKIITFASRLLPRKSIARTAGKLNRTR